MEDSQRQAVTVNIQGMNCARCVRAVTAAVSAVDDVELKHAEVGRVDVAVRDRQALAAVIDAIREAGYESQPAEHSGTEVKQRISQRCAKKD